MAHRYVLQLSKQYANAKGDKKKYLTLDEEFIKWLYDYQRTLDILKDQYDELGIKYNSYDSFETNKGLDKFIIESFAPLLSTELDRWYKATGVYPLNSNDPTKRIDKIMVDSLIASDKNRISKYIDNERTLGFNSVVPIYEENSVNYDLSGAKLMYTYNPYREEDLSLYPALWSVKKAIAISVCGNNDDKDRKSKIYMLNNQSNYLKQLYDEGKYQGFPIKESRKEIDDKYFYTVYTDPTPTYGSARMR